MIRLLGHQNIEREFSEAMQKGSLHHAWLLYGMKGIGKSVLAEKLAARLICESHTACGECHACRMLAVGSHPDVHHLGLIEGKRDLKIEQVREVLDFLSLSGAESARRVVILDDAERMNGQAANALLKGLEEPSPGSLLLIVCADMMRLPATVRSRCLLQRCTPLPEADVRTVLQRLSVPDQYLDMAIELADGCPGAVECMQEEKLSNSLALWCDLVSNVAQADMGKIESWLQQHVKLIPHSLIIRVLLRSVFPVLMQSFPEESFESREKLHTAVSACARWPNEVVRQSLRPAPSLLADVFQLRGALRTIT
jgi:DNA polymerase III delta' subunit